jgi:uncharacterized protein (DUF1499 family)
MNLESSAIVPPRWPAVLVRIGLWLLGVALVLLILAGPLYRLGALPLRLALLALLAVMFLVIASFVLLLIGVIASSVRRVPHPAALSMVALLLSGILMLNFGFWAKRAFGVPPIHDISTDLDDPPDFADVIALREQSGAVNPPDYVRETKGRDGMINVPDAQRRAYPDLQPGLLNMPPAEAFAAADRAARSMGWDIVASVPNEGRIEATDTTTYFGFADDISIRVRASGPGSRVDVRSKSRVGMSDLGANAARIRRYLAELAEQN